MHSPRDQRERVDHNERLHRENHTPGLLESTCSGVRTSMGLWSIKLSIVLRSNFYVAFLYLEIYEPLRFYGGQFTNYPVQLISIMRSERPLSHLLIGFDKKHYVITVNGNNNVDDNVHIVKDKDFARD